MAFSFILRSHQRKGCKFYVILWVCANVKILSFYRKNYVRMGAEEMVGVRKDKSSKTTEIYTHVGDRDLGKIKSPLDNLELRGDVKK